MVDLYLYCMHLALRCVLILEVEVKVKGKVKFRKIKGRVGVGDLLGKLRYTP